MTSSGLARAHHSLIHFAAGAQAVEDIRSFTPRTHVTQDLETVIAKEEQAAKEAEALAQAKAAEEKAAKEEEKAAKKAAKEEAAKKAAEEKAAYDAKIEERRKQNAAK